MFSDLLNNGRVTSPRGQKVLEIENYQMDLSKADRFSNFTARKMNLQYIKEEFKWYLRADPFDASICEHASMWKKIQQPDGRFHSNYGQYWFGSQQGARWVLETLRDDSDSRQAIIPMLNKDHLYKGNTDIVCTESISFRIRDGKLNMSVNMRSNDAIFGITNDVPAFSFLHEMIAVVLNIPVGNYCHKADSLHVYERHFKMLENIVKDGLNEYKHIDVPDMTYPEIFFMLNPSMDITHFKGYDNSIPFLNWLNS